MSPHHFFEDIYWNLAQACAWVEYREKQLVNDFSMPDRDAYKALGMYPSMWPVGRQRHGFVEDLRRALEHGRIKSSGYRRNTPDNLEEIPAAEWTDLQIRPPLASFAERPNNQPWHRVRLLSADMKRLWRSVNELSGRSKFDPAAIRAVYEDLSASNPDMSQNELIIELQGTFEERFKKKPPSRSTIQRNIST